MKASIFLAIDAANDTMAMMDSNKVAEFYADMMDKQATQFVILISVLCGIVALVTFVSLWWNVKGAKQQIVEESENNKRAFQRLFKASTSKMEENLNASLQEKADALSANAHHELEEYKKSISETIDTQQAELNRVFALHCDGRQSYFSAATWWYTAARLYHKTGNDRFAQISVDAGLLSLKNAVKNSVKLEEEDTDKLDTILSDVNALPDTLSSQKTETKKQVKKLRSAIKE